MSESDSSSSRSNRSFYTSQSSFDDVTLLVSSPASQDSCYGSIGAMPPTSNKASDAVDLDALQANCPGYGTNSTFGSAMNLVNAMMGSGIIGLPLALHLCGFWAGIAISIMVAGLTCTAMHLLVLSGIRAGQYTLVDLCRVSLTGAAGAQVVNFLLVFHTGGTALSYYILLGDMLPHLLGDMLPCLANRQVAVVSFGFIFCMPLCLPRSMAPLAKWSTLGVLLLPIILVCVATRVPVYHHPFELVWINPSVSQIFKGLAILSLSFGCSQNVFSIFLSQRDQRPHQFLVADSTAILIGYVINITFAVLGFLCFGDQTIKANVLLNFPQDDRAINLARLTLCAFILITIPMSLHPCREALQKMLGHNTEGRIPSNKQHYFVTLLVFGIVLYLGATLTELGQVFGIVGGFSTTAIGLLLPAAAYISIFFPELVSRSKSMDDPSVVKGSWMLMSCAIFLVIISGPIMYFAIADVLL
ncbi:transmembrane amino acid transporter protein-domain-containing protein [Dichotomocladium elegans]|nr:transmembrane amino acid transporter protein-domain-containing protein [Dichotomocladium elegans]